MVKNKQCFLRVLMILPLISLSAVSHATDNSSRLVGAIEQDLLKVVALLDKRSGSTAASGVLSAPDSNQSKSTVKLVSNGKSGAASSLGIEELVGMDLDAFMAKPAAKQAPVNTAKKSKPADPLLTPQAYKQVMGSVNQSSKRKRSSYRPCYKYNYHELQNKSRRYQKSIEEASRLHGVSEELIKSVITAESCFKVRARSHKGARGLMQLMPATARRFGVSNSYNSHQNIGAGARYLRWLLDRYQGNMHFALAGYNAGEGKVDRYGGIPPYKETREYVRRVMGVYKTLYGKRERSANETSDYTQKTRADYHRIWLQKQRAKQQIAQSDKPLSEQRCLKAVPAHLNATTRLKRSGRGGRIWRRYYQLNANENLANVMHKTGVHINSIKRMNHLTSKSTLAPGRQLLVWECRI